MVPTDTMESWLPWKTDWWRHCSCLGSIGMIDTACLLPFSKQRVASWTTSPCPCWVDNSLGPTVAQPKMMASQRRSSVAHRLVVSKILVQLWVVSSWFHLGGPHHVRPAATLACQSSAPLVSRACLPQGLEVDKFQSCAPTLLPTSKLERMLQEAREYKRTSPKEYCPRRMPDEEGRWRCNKCGDMLPEKAFYLKRTVDRHIPLSVCKECKRTHILQWRRMLRGNLQEMVPRENSWTVLWLLTTCVKWFLRQGARCAYWGVPMEMCTLHTATGGCPWRDETTTWAIPTKIKCTCCCRVKNTGDFSQHKSDEKVRDSQRKCSVVTQEGSCSVWFAETDHRSWRLAHRGSARQKQMLRFQGCQWGPTVQQAGQIFCRACAEFLHLGNFTSSAIELLVPPWGAMFRRVQQMPGTELRREVKNAPWT